MAKKQKLELTWIGKDTEPRLEPRLLIEQPEHRTGTPTAENMLIHGDNLLALKALEAQFTGRIKCIYIDPPYNTGSAFEHYDDGIEHSLWLSLMRDRLAILRKLLREDGSIWVTLDDNEAHYCKVLMDEIFGRQNFVANVLWQKRTSPDNRLRLGAAHDHLLVYSKRQNSHQLFNQLSVSETRKKDFKNPDNDPSGPWASTDCTAQAGHGTANQFYSLVTPSGRKIELPSNLCWRFTKERMEEEIKAGRIWFGKDGMGVPRKKTYLTEINGQNAWSWWTNSEVGHNQEAKKEIVNLFGDSEIFATPKPERLIERVLTLATNPGDWVLDSFLGSGTTAAVAHKMGRKWVGIELGEHCYTHCLPRLQKVVSGADTGGISKAVGWQGGGGFRVFRLAPTLINEDRYGQPVISAEYDAAQLAAAVALHNGYRYQPDAEVYWRQSQGSNHDWLYVTTAYLSRTLIDSIAAEMAAEERLLICCTHFDEGIGGSAGGRISIRKIPQVLLGKCEFKADSDYSLNIVHVPAEHDDTTDAPYPDDIDSTDTANDAPDTAHAAPKKANPQQGSFDF